MEHTTGTKVTRREYLKYAGTAVVAGAAGLAAGYGLFSRPEQQKPPEEKVTGLSIVDQSGGNAPTVEYAMRSWSAQSGVDVFFNPLPATSILEKDMAEGIAQSTTFDITCSLLLWKGVTGPFYEDLMPYVNKYGPDLNTFAGGADGGLVAVHKYNGKLLGLPFRVNFENMTFYRKDLYEKYGLSVPNTLEEFENNCKVLTANGMYGVGFEYGGDPDCFMDINDWFANLGGRWLTEKNDAVAPYDPNGVVLVNILEMLKRVIDKGYAPPGVLSWTFLEEIQNYQNGNIAIMRQSPGRVAVIEDPKTSKAAGKTGYAIGLANPPQSELAGPMWKHIHAFFFPINRFISQARKEIAYQALMYMASEKMQKETLLKTANVPTLTSIIDGPDFRGFWPTEAVDVFLEGMKIGSTPPLIPQTTTLIKNVQEEVGNVFTNKKTPEQAVKDLWASNAEMLATTT